jgi:EmrB/QacA subfamily drug resistance transporter
MEPSSDSARGPLRPPASPGNFEVKERVAVVAAALLALFLGALDTLVMGAAMPTVVTDLGGLDLYGWVFSVYLLSRAVSLPIFGKLADLFSSRRLFVAALAVFMAGSLCAGLSRSMPQLIASRALQGVGAGATFALVYILLADISPPERRGKMLSSASLVWGLASVLGPPLGGFIVNYGSWRWIFFINIPLGILSLGGIHLYFRDVRPKRTHPAIDYLGSLALVLTVLPLLSLFLLAGQRLPWLSLPVIAIGGLSVAGAVAFYHVEKRAAEPILPISFFKTEGFRAGIGASFFSSFAIFSLAAFSPLFLQGALGQTPVALGLAMIPLSLAWSGGALVCGQTVHRFKNRPSALLGGLLLMLGSAAALSVSRHTPVAVFSLVLAVAGLGMGFVSIASLIAVQDSLPDAHLGVATASHQFFRTMGGTVGVGISGSLLNMRFFSSLAVSGVTQRLPAEVSAAIGQTVSVESLFRPDILAILPRGALDALQISVGAGVVAAFWAAALAAVACLAFCFLVPGTTSSGSG